MYCIETTHLSHYFSKDVKVIDDINMQVPYNSIYGFLGPNGAGKTTTLRLLLGLLKKQQGNIAIFGQPFQTKRIEILSRLGSLIESPSIYSQLTAMENLRVLYKHYRCSKERLNEVLHLVDLSHTGNKKAGEFSLGMKQRLSIAIALLSNPKLLILDEPTNGLDPNGIIEMRALLKRLNEDMGMTILVSSHLLSEIEKLVSHVGIIHQGKMLFQGTLEALVNKQRQSSQLIIDTSDNIKSMALLKQSALSVELVNDKMVLPLLERADIATINKQLISKDISVFEISTQKNDLETIFINLVNS
jgi:lantibiotic transport system ATP-binding protein